MIIIQEHERIFYGESIYDLSSSNHNFFQVFCFVKCKCGSTFAFVPQIDPFPPVEVALDNCLYVN